MKRTLMLVAAAATLLALSCNPAGSGSYFPLALDNTWHWRTTSVTTWRGTIDTTITRIDSSTMTVVSDTLVGGKSAWKLRSQSGAQTGYNYLVEDDDRILSYAAPDDDSPSLLLKLPLAENSSWVVDSSSDPRVIATVKQKDVVTVPAGRFSGAWLVEQKADTVDAVPTRQWYAAGVGHVKWSVAFTNAAGGDTMSTTIDMELMRYDMR